MNEELPEISFTIPLKAANGKGKRAEKFRLDAKEYIPEWMPEYSNHSKRYSLKVIFYYLGECNGDMDNRLLCIFDALKGKVIYDDFQIKELNCKMVEDSERTAIFISVKEIPPHTPSKKILH